MIVVFATSGNINYLPLTHAKVNTGISVWSGPCIHDHINFEFYQISTCWEMQLAVLPFWHSHDLDLGLRHQNWDKYVKPKCFLSFVFITFKFKRSHKSSQKNYVTNWCFCCKELTAGQLVITQTCKDFSCNLLTPCTRKYTLPEEAQKQKQYIASVH